MTVLLIVVAWLAASVIFASGYVVGRGMQRQEEP